MLIKFCGLTRQEDCDMARELGANFCGFIFHPKSPRFIPPEKAAHLRCGPSARVGVFTGNDAGEIVATARAAHLDYVQLHGNQPEAVAKAIGLPVIRVLWPERHGSIQELSGFASGFGADYFLLDAGKSGGGSGKALDFATLADIRLTAPWLLAGGLDAGNITEALAACSPAGLDINSGVESAPGLKDVSKMKEVGNILKELNRVGAPPYPTPVGGPRPPNPPSK